MTGIMCATFAGGAILIETITNGYYHQDLGKGNYNDWYGYDDGSLSGTAFGSISVANFPPTGTAVKTLSYLNSNGSAYYIYFAVGGNQLNSGWTQMVIDGVAYTRASATNYVPSSTYTYWYWTVTSTNPFSGITTTAVFS